MLRKNKSVAKEKEPHNRSQIHQLEESKKEKPVLIPSQDEENPVKKFTVLRQKSRIASSKYFTTKTTNFNKCSATVSTKIPTRYEKITLSNASIGLRGLSIKYDVTNLGE